MLELSVKKKKLELAGYTPDTTLSGFLQEVETFTSSQKKGVPCRMCGECCGFPPVLGLDMQLQAARQGVSVKEWAQSNLEVPALPDLASRQKGIAELRSQMELPELEAAVLYECNQSEPFTFRRGEDGRCFRQKDNLCGDYLGRLYICRLYLCGFGEKLQNLEEMIVTQGTWHAYALLGAIPMEAIAHNPFVKAASFDDVLLKDFEFGLEGALEELFSYF